ncbi:hypothetical protein [Psychrobacter glacincola]|uniref:hypothetical protein n=1 Tax=Psychrobacter glacincola TaxID=56810 RepID=UPI00191862EA|nr:hypothetical protein [Psychrobacter glacincola]
MGSVATKLERDAYEKAKSVAMEKGEVFNGIAPVTIRGEINAMIAERNSLVLEASNRIIFEQRDYDERLERAERYIDRANQSIRNTKRQIERTEQDIEWSSKRCKNLPSWIDGNHKAVESNTKDILTQHKQMTSSYKELTTQNSQLTASLKLSESQILQLTEQLSKAQDQLQAPLMTTTDEPFMSEKDELIESLESRINKLTEKVTQMRKTIMILERR